MLDRWPIPLPRGETAQPDGVMSTDPILEEAHV